MKYQDVMGNILNINSPAVDSIFDFKKALLFAHEFLGDNEDVNGWISAVIDFKNIIDKNLSLGMISPEKFLFYCFKVVWTTDMVRITIDEFGQIEKEIL